MCFVKIRMREQNVNFQNAPPEKYKQIWKPLTKGPRFQLFLGIYIGCAILGVGSVHQMQKSPK